MNDPDQLQLVELPYDIYGDQDIQAELDVLRRQAFVDLMFSRQSELVPERVAELNVLIVGCGSIGSNAAHILASMGVQRFTLIDFDSVGVENIGPSWYDQNDVDEPKVRALATRLLNHFGLDEVLTHERPLSDNEQGHFDVVISAVDSLEVREALWLSKVTGDLWLDGRMGGWNAEFYTICSNDEAGKQMYNSSFQGDVAALPCGMKATAAITKGFFPLCIAEAVRLWVMGEAQPHLILFNGRETLSKRFIYAN